MTNPLWIIIPAFDEAEYISRCIEGLADQSDHNFRVVLVDNACTDETVKIAKDTAAKSNIKIDVIQEIHKGTGWACQTGFQYALDQGAGNLARIDADSVPDKEWVKEIRHLFHNGYDFIGGRLKPYPNESLVAKLKFTIIFLIIRLIIYKRRLKGRYLSRFIVSPGANLAITARLYEAIGGFSRTSIETHNEDLDLSDRAVEATGRVAESRKAIVYTSARRINTLGLRGTLRWYGKKTEQADIR